MKRIILTFMALALGFSASAQISQKEFDALKSFYETTGGPSWTNHSGWDFETCDASGVRAYNAKTGEGWFGIKEIRGGHVGKLELSDNGLTGELPEALWDLEYLRTLNLSNNGLKGKLSPRVGKMKYLLSLILSNNMLEGTIPDALVEMGAEAKSTAPSADGKGGNQIKVLLNKNRFTGEIPARIGEMTLLGKPAKSVTLDFSNNQLTGGIPESMSRLTGLTSFKAANNRLSGEVPAFLEKLPSLQVLRIEKNAFKGAVPRK